MKNQNLIKTLYDCVAHCNYCADACLDEPDVKKMVECIRLDRKCAAVCAATALAFCANSEQSQNLLQTCAEICEECAQECSKHEAQHCQDCAEACRKCATACKGF
ncbi:MAG TPA: four-helix bundle copper-binding protein [Flavobacteriaceae bacterium]|nr:four-helix bundle copper-binding protein [Flavobacteriaceae bacterium]